MKQKDLVKLKLKSNDLDLKEIAKRMARAKPKRGSKNVNIDNEENMLGGDYKVDKVPDVKVFPFSAVGKLLFKQDGITYSGSAWMCANGGIFTAAHNLYDEGVVSEDVMFCPQYHGGFSPLGVAVGITGWVPKMWYDNEDALYDMASCTMDQDLGHSTGIIHCATNRPIIKNEAFMVVGYPSEPTAHHDYQGEYMWYSKGKLEAGDPSLIISMSSDFSEGSSGGPWIIEGNSANGTTFRTIPDDEQIISTYFDNLATQLVNAVS